MMPARDGISLYCLLALAAMSLSACGTAHLANEPAASRSQLAVVRGDLKLGPLGNATVRLEEVDGKDLGRTQRQAQVSAGKHSLVFSCKEAIKNISSSGQLIFVAKAGHTYDLQLRQLHQPQDCSAVLIDAATQKVVAKPEALKHPPHL
jgi:hypothetical protein